MINGSQIQIVIFAVVGFSVYFAMKYCRENRIENPILSLRVWWSERKDRA